MCINQRSAQCSVQATIPLAPTEVETLARQYEQALEVQAGCQKRIRSEVNRAVSKVIFSTALAAIEDNRGVLNGRTFSGKFKVVSAPTGSSKTTSAVAFAVAGYNSIPGFSCAFIVEEIRTANEVYEQLNEMLPEGVAGIWTSSNNADRPPESNKGKYPLFHLDHMKDTQIVVFTHSKWLSEMEKDSDWGVRKYKGIPRDVMFIDEQPAVTEVITRTPSKIEDARDDIMKFDPEHPWVETLELVHDRMNDAYKTNGSAFEYVELLHIMEAAKFSEERAEAIWREHYGYGPTSYFKETFRFLHAATLGYCFLGRQVPREFTAYLPKFRAEPNQVLLDATADISGLSLMMGGELAEGLPAIDYSNLTINHLDHPREFSKVNQVVKNRDRAVSYSEWIRASVVSNTSDGDTVLVVMHKDMIEAQGLFPHSPTTALPNVFPGRNTFVIWWGQGIGSNQYKDCTKVFLFSEFYAPQKATVAKTLGAKYRPASEADLTNVNTKLTGDYLTAEDGHLLRWTKQLACRGNVRNVSADGVCGRMDLYTSMDFKRLVKNLDSLFPGARAPTRKKPKVKPDQQSKGGRDGLINLLSTTDAIRVSSREVEALVGIESRNLRAELSSTNVAAVAATYGWSLTTSKSLGLPGKGNWLVRTTK